MFIYEVLQGQSDFSAVLFFSKTIVSIQKLKHKLTQTNDPNPIEVQPESIVYVSQQHPFRIACVRD